MDYFKRIDNIILKNKNLCIENSFNDNNQKEEIINYLNNDFISNNDIIDKIKNITDMVYFQDWKKLHIINKKIKIIEFLDNLNNKKKFENIEEIKKLLIDKLFNKKLNKKFIQYDSINGKILDITCLSINNNKCIINC